MYYNLLKAIKSIIEENRTHQDRIEKCRELYGVKGIEEKVSSMGPGGTGLIRYFPKYNITRIQIGCNYGGVAPCVWVTGNVYKHTKIISYLVSDAFKNDDPENDESAVALS